VNLLTDFEDQLQNLLSRHKSEAETYVTSTASYVTYKAFSDAFYEINGSTINSTITNDYISIDFYRLIQLVNKWINELDYIVDDINTRLYRLEIDTVDDINPMVDVRNKIEYDIIRTYGTLKAKIEEIETNFSNISIAYKTIVESSYNDMLIFHNNYTGNKGDFSDFKDVSVYIHGIDDDGGKFLSTMPDVSSEGDIVIHEQRNDDTEYFIVVADKHGNLSLSESYNEKEIKNTTEYKSGLARIHMVYETEFRNEHRQKTSNDLSKALIDLGLMYGDKNIKLHAHSYGGRRSWQFAVDYPEYVEAITTIGTPYETNKMAELGENIANIGEFIPGILNKYPLEDGNHIEIDTLTEHAGEGIALNDNAYGDMINTSLDEVVEEVYSYNPEVYAQIEDIYATAVVGKQMNNPLVWNADFAVSTHSQSGEVMGNFIDEAHVVHIFNHFIAHSAETTHDFFKNIMKNENDTIFR